MTTYSDIPLDLQAGATVITDKAVILQRVRTVLTTEQGEFIGKPTFGTPLKQYQYMPYTNDMEVFLRMTIIESLRTWVGDEVTVSNVKFSFDESTHLLTISVHITLNSFQEDSVVTVEASVGA